MDRRLFTILMIVFVQMLGAALILPILPLFAQREFNLQPASITLLVSSFFAAQLLAGPYIGQLSDKYGRVPILIISQLGTTISFFLLAVAGVPWLLFAARIFDGITGGNIIVAQAYITDITPKEKRTEALGYVFAVFGIGFILGPALGGFLSAWLGPRVPYLVAAAAALLTAGLTWFTLDETIEPGTKQETSTALRPSLTPLGVLKNPALMLVLAVAFIGQFGFGMLQSTFALYAEAVLYPGATDETVNLGIGLLLAIIGVGQFFTQTVLLRRMVARYGNAWLVIIGDAIRGISLVLFAIIASPWPAAGASLIFAIGMGLMMPPLQSISTRTVPENLRGGVLGVYQSSVSLAIIFSTAIAGVIFATNPTTPYWIGAALSFLALLPAIALLRNPRFRE
jgi:DHA1 family tetracycline resistance protein-like MFS transporter